MNKLKKLLILIVLTTAFTSGVFGYRVLAADTVELSVAYNLVLDAIANQDGSTVEDPYYEVNSYQAFTQSIDLLGGTIGIQAVIDDDLAEQTTVDQYTQDINQALAGLTLDDTYNLVLGEYTSANSLDLSTYTTDSQTLYNEELNRIEAILNSATSGEVIIQALSDDITAANDLLVLIGDKTDLNTLNQLLIDAFYENSELYTDTSHLAFTQACEAFGSYLYVNSIIASTNVTQSEIDDLETLIEDALDLLVLLVDNSSLITMYYQLSIVDLSSYTQNSRDAYNNELDRLYQIIIGEELDEDTANSVLLDLANLDVLLVLLSDYTELQELYDSLDIYREEDYSISSYASLNHAKQNAYTILNDLNATQEEIDQGVVYLETTVEELELTIKTIYIQEQETFDITEYITLGQATILGYTILNEDIISINEEGIVEALSYGDTKISVILSNGAVEEVDIFVTARLTTSTYVVIISVPVACAGLGALLVYSKKSFWLKISKTITGIFKKKK